jgi:hypothetical protein
MKRLRRLTRIKRETKRLEIQRKVFFNIGVAVLWLLCVFFLVRWIMSLGTPKTHSTPSSSATVQEVKADEPTRFCGDKLSYIRCASQDAGLTDKDASLLIRIARAESGCKLNEKATNGSSTASGEFQILWGTWNSNNCQGNAFNYKDSTNCAIKIYKLRGTQPWETSAHQRSGNGWVDPNQCL